jgi:hypothetical protein
VNLGGRFSRDSKRRIGSARTGDPASGQARICIFQRLEIDRIESVEISLTPHFKALFRMGFRPILKSLSNTSKDLPHSSQAHCAHHARTEPQDSNRLAHNVGSDRWADSRRSPDIRAKIVVAAQWITSPWPGWKPHHVPLALVNIYLVGVNTFADCIYGIVVAGALNHSLLKDGTVRTEK